MAKVKKVFLVMLSLSLVMYMVSGYEGRMVGGRTEVRDVKSNIEVQELGRFAVEEFNRQRRRHGNGRGGEIIFLEVVEAQTQVVSGIKYYLKIEATDWNGETVMYDSEVVVKPWLHSKELLKFAPSIQLRVRK